MYADLVGSKIRNEKQGSEILDELQLARFIKEKYEVYSERRDKELIILHIYALFSAKLHPYPDS